MTSGGLAVILISLKVQIAESQNQSGLTMEAPCWAKAGLFPDRKLPLVRLLVSISRGQFFSVALFIVQASLSLPVLPQPLF